MMQMRALAVGIAIVWASAAGGADEKGATPVTAQGGNPVVLMKTSMGDIKIELDKAKAPVTVENFLVYVNDKFYDGTIFHRVIPAFMIQGGGFDKDMNQKKTQGADQERGRQRAEEPERHARHGAHQRSEQRHGAVLHQREGQRLPRSPQRHAAGLRLRGVRQGVDGMDVVQEDRAGARRRPRRRTRTCRSRR